MIKVIQGPKIFKTCPRKHRSHKIFEFIITLIMIEYQPRTVNNSQFTSNGYWLMLTACNLLYYEHLMATYLHLAKLLARNWQAIKWQNIELVPSSFFLVLTMLSLNSLRRSLTCNSNLPLPFNNANGKCQLLTSTPCHTCQQNMLLAIRCKRAIILNVINLLFRMF